MKATLIPQHNAAASRLVKPAPAVLTAPPRMPQPSTLPAHPPQATPADKTGPGRPGFPAHVAIIMDGNGRWAKQRGLPRLEGHRRGVDAVRNIIFAGRDLGLGMLTLYAFSVENWKRPKSEISGLMHLLQFFLKRELSTFVRERVALRTIGRVHEMPEGVQKILQDAADATASFHGFTVVLALNYGSRTEVADAAAAFGAAVADGREKSGPLTWENLRPYLYTAGMPDPDLVIRTSGETRISNFLLLQAAYAEFIFSPVLWPDFTKADLSSAIEEYARRERRYGLTSEQLKPGPAC
jgi:undecaprenyl diphosphate synthase